MDTINAKGYLLDMDGVFYVGGKLLDGARSCLRELQKRDIPFRFVTNTTTKTKVELMEKLEGLGLPVEASCLFTAVSATKRFLESRGSPSLHLLVRDTVKKEFSRFELDADTPDYVVIGDIGANWDYETLNDVFNMLMRGSKLLCMHRNKFWQDENGLRMDIGAFVAALEHVSDQKATVVGKPTSSFFQQAVGSMELEVDQVAMVGDDIEADVGGAQSSGLQGVLVKTGKYRPELVSRSSVRPDFVLDSIAQLPDRLG
ncbi:TIGR01458 family HAD-type hydrolase [Pelagicoccus sp. SDUM812003]|uniref:TIGR01458 family HAD-type hydrolase n=1 Tax=Pelagicoccus sp. SDUM812003 TaxID=3041267 RepID=UPI00280C6D13|nr:TIGR01458 family HAD-type hydrolase [Pelagicoccus sp. SDUM812003]MDQ8203770.1 TIGR01458 family HAD-type hydrolase [Pelagicoccus sp. SDUM812003]